MDNSLIYEEIMLNKSLVKLKYNRNCWRDDVLRVGLSSIIEMSGTEYWNYKIIMERCELILLNTVFDVIEALLVAYGIPHEWKQIEECDDRYYRFDGKLFKLGGKVSKRYNTLSCNGILYMFREQGDDFYYLEFINGICSFLNLDDSCYVTLIEGDPDKGIVKATDVNTLPKNLSLKEFFESVFNPEEYTMFKSYAKKLSLEIKDYYAFNIVTSLRPNTLLPFRSTLVDELNCFEINDFDKTGRITESQKEIINNQYFNNENYRLLLGKSDYAKSYITAEWLYRSLSESNNIDLTSIAMGYFKSIEQLFFKFISLHTQDRDQKTRMIYIGNNKKTASLVNADGYAVLTDDLISNHKYSRYIQLAALSRFFGEYDNKKGTYNYYNSDLLISGIDQHTHEFIIEVFTSVAGLRNGFFHRHNLYNWADVTDAKNKAELVFYLLLGCYNISESDRKELGWIATEEHDDYYRLCDYIHNTAMHFNSSLIMKYNDIEKLPVYYFDAKANKEDFYGPFPDDYIDYDEWGNPRYSGIFLKDYSNDMKKRFTKENLPKEIWEGTLIRDNSKGKIENHLSGPQKKIYSDNKYCES